MTQTAGSLHPIDQHFLLQDDINDYIFTKYIEQYFRQDQRFQARNAPLTSSLLRTQRHDVASDALAVFQLVIKILGRQINGFAFA